MFLSGNVLHIFDIIGIFQNFVFCVMLSVPFCCHKVFSVVRETIYISYVFSKNYHRALCCIVSIRSCQVETIYLILLNRIWNMIYGSVSQLFSSGNAKSVFDILATQRTFKNILCWCYTFCLEFCCLKLFSLVGKTIDIEY